MRHWHLSWFALLHPLPVSSIAFLSHPLVRLVRFTMKQSRVITYPFPNVQRYKWEAYCDADGMRTVMQMGAAQI